MKAVQQNLIGLRADLSAGGFNQRQSQVLHRIFHAKEVARDFSPRRKQRDAAGVDELLEFCVPDISKTDGGSQLADRILTPSEEMPALLSLRPTICVQILPLLGGGQ